MSLTAEIVGTIAVAVLTGSLLCAAASDLQRYLIPNRYPAAILLAFLAQAPLTPYFQSLGGLAVGAAVLAAGALLFARGLLGGGDVKLLAAVAFWAGPSMIATFLFVTSLTGAVLALTLLSPARRLFPAHPNALAVPGDFRGRLRQPMPFAVAIAAGGLFVAAARVPYLMP